MSAFMLLILLMLPQCSFADMGTSHASGEFFGASSSIFNGKTEDVPGFAGDSPPEAVMDSSGLSDAASQKMGAKDSAGDFLHHSNRTRQNFSFDSETDPLLKTSHDVVKDPITAMNLVEEPIEETGSFETKKCTKPLTFEFTCDWIYAPEIRWVESEEKRITQNYNLAPFYRETGAGCYLYTLRYGETTADLSRAGINAGWEYVNSIFNASGPRVEALIKQYGGWQEGTIYLRSQFGGYSSWAEDWSDPGGNKQDGHIIYRASNLLVHYNYKSRIAQTVQNWSTQCGAANQFIESGDYILVKEEIIEGPETRTIEGVAVTAEAWRIRRTYRAAGEGVDTCGPLLKAGCEHVTSKCLKEINGRCVLQENEFRCLSSSNKLARTRLKGDAPFCLDGNCHSVSWEANTDMMTALSHLALLKEMQPEAASGSIFKGQNLQCTKHCAGFSDCCQVSGGWGQGIGFANCSEGEKDLAKRRGQRKCVFVGTYCAEKVLGICIRKKSSYCCFGNKLSRIIQEQGRGQVGRSWGDAKCPDCGGFSVDELSRMAFDRMNLSEAFEDVAAKIKNIDVTTTTQRFSNDWQARLPKAPNQHSLPQKDLEKSGADKTRPTTDEVSL